MAGSRVSLAALAVLALGLSAARSLLFVAVGGPAPPRSASVAVRAEKPAAAEKKPAAPAAEKKPAAAKPKPKPAPAKKKAPKVWNPAMKKFEDSTSAWENPTVEGMSHPMGFYFPEIKPEKPKKGYYYNRAWKKVEVDGPNDPTTAGLPGWDLETNAKGLRSYEQERTYGWYVGPGIDNVSLRPVR